MLRNFSLLAILTDIVFVYHVLAVSSIGILASSISLIALFATFLTYFAQRYIRLYVTKQDQRHLTRADIEGYIRAITGLWYGIGIVSAFVPFWINYSYQPLAYGIFLIYSCSIFVILIVSNPLDFTRINKL